MRGRVRIINSNVKPSPIMMHVLAHLMIVPTEDTNVFIEYTSMWKLPRTILDGFSHSESGTKSYIKSLSSLLFLYISILNFLYTKYTAFIPLEVFIIQIQYYITNIWHRTYITLPYCNNNISITPGFDIFPFL